MTISPHLSTEDNEYKVTVKEFDFKNKKTKDIKSFTANISDYGYGTGKITNKEVIVDYIDEDGSERQWRKSY